MTRIHKRNAVLLSILLLLVAAVALLTGEAAVHVATVQASPIERTLEDAGFEVARVASSPAGLVSMRALQADVLILVNPGPLPTAEKAQIKRFVESGGTLWVFSNAPSHVLWLADTGELRVHAGYIFARDGSPATYTTNNPEASRFEALGLQRLEVLIPHESIWISRNSTFRDTNGNRHLEAGEPIGPFISAAHIPVGGGHVLMVASALPSALPPTAIASLAGSASTGQVALWEPMDAGIPRQIARHALSILAQPAVNTSAAVLMAATGAASLLFIVSDRASARADAREQAFETLARNWATSRAAATREPARQPGGNGGTR